MDGRQLANANLEVFRIGRDRLFCRLCDRQPYSDKINTGRHNGRFIC